MVCLDRMSLRIRPNRGGGGEGCGSGEGCGEVLEGEKNVVMRIISSRENADFTAHSCTRRKVPSFNIILNGSVNFFNKPNFTNERPDRQS